MVIPLLPSPPIAPKSSSPSPALVLDLVTARNGTIVLKAHSADQPTVCPDCQCQSNHVHSHYCRKLLDLPWQGQTVRIELTVRKLYCDKEECQRRVFTERLPNIVARYARKTDRLADALRELAFLAGGEAAARIARAFGLSISPDALLDSLPRGFGAALPRRFAAGPRSRLIGDLAEGASGRRGHQPRQRRRLYRGRDKRSAKRRPGGGQIPSD